MSKRISLVLFLNMALSCAAAAPSTRGIAPPPRPVWFEENTGQASEDIAFIGRGFSVPVALMKDGSLALATPSGQARLQPNGVSRLGSYRGELPTGGVTKTYGPGGSTTSRHFQRVRFANLWPGADLFYRIRNGQLELGLDLVAGRSWTAPTLRWNGASATVDQQGRLHVSAAGLSFSLGKPSAFQPDTDIQEHPVEVSYALSPQGDLGFQIVGASPALPLTIDPVFDFSTYLGGSQLDSIYGMALGPDGSIYLTGQTASPSLFGSPTGAVSGSGKAMVIRLAPGGVGVVFFAVIGGTYNDQGQAIAVDLDGNAYVTGYTDSPDFLTTANAFQTTAPADWNAFAIKLDSAGDLVYSTFLGGSGADRGLAVAVDGAGRAIVAGQTGSADFPVTSTAYQQMSAGSDDCFVTMLAADGTAAVFSTFLGGSGLDGCHAVAVDSSGTITVAGATQSSNFPVSGAFQSTSGGFLDGFVAQLSSDGSTLLSSSYLGGIGQDQIAAVVLDAGGDVYVAGSSSSQIGFPGTGAGVVTTTGSGTKGFACMISPGLAALNWCSIVGGSGNDYVYALALQPSGNVVVAGQTSSVNLPLQNALPFSFQGAADGWFAILAAAGNQWQTVSYTGGAGTNTVYVVQAMQDRILLAGATTAVNLPVTTAAIQPTPGGDGDGFLQEVAMSNDMVLNGIYPLSGIGLNHILNLVVTNPSGGQAIQSIQVNVSNPYSTANACAVTFGISAKTIALANDAGTGNVGSAAIGSNATLQNSQCTANAAGTTMAVVGNSVVVRVSLTYLPAFGAVGGGMTKYVNVIATDNQGNTLSVVQAASWSLVAPQPPVVVALTPSSGQGLSQIFALTVSDSAGANDLASVRLLFANSTSLSSACAVTYISQQKNLGLTNDAGTGYAGYVTPGQTGSVSNSQCTLSGAGSSIQTSGNSLIMTASLQFNTAFASAGSGASKTIYANPVNSAGQGPSGGIVSAGTWTIPKPGSPTVISLSPSSGQGLSQIFALTVSDSAGANDLVSVQLLFANSTSLSSACAVTYISQQKNLGLTNDAGTGYAGYVTPGQTGSVSNSQCTLSGAGSSIQTSGNSLIMTASLQFNTAFASVGSSAAKTIFANPVNSAGQGPTGGMATIGTWTIPTPPIVVSLTPASGQGSSQAFALTVSDLAGANDLASVQLLFANSTSLSSACAVTYVSQQKNLGLTNDAGTGYAGYVTPGQAGSVSNSQCTLSGAGSSIQTSGNSLIMTASLQFNTAFASAGSGASKTIYANASNSAGQGPSGGMVSAGSWTIPKAGLPTIVSLSPSSGQGTSQAFALTVSDPAGASDLASVQLLVANSTGMSKACAVTYSSQQKTVGLANDAGTGNAGSVTPGQAGSVSNSQCSLSGIGSSIKSSGNSLIMIVSLQFKTAFASIGSGATKSVYANAINSAGQGPTGGMTVKGTWTIPTPPTVVSLSPASGQGSSQAFALTVADSAGGSDISSSEIIFSSAASLNAACVVVYISSQKQFGLLNDAASNYVAFLAPGANSSISNSQCTLNGSGSSIKISGNNLTMTVSLQFKPAFKTTGSATKKVYGYPVSSAGLTPPNWVAMGSWTVQ